MERVNPIKHVGVALVLILLSIAGAIIGIQLITTIGVTPNTSIIGALFAMLLARIPLQAFRRYRSIEIQNLAQTAISSATFGAANSLLMPIAVPWVLGEPQLVLPLFCGVSAAMLLDAWLLYRLFDTRVFPASNACHRALRQQKRSKRVIKADARRGCWCWALWVASSVPC